MIKNLILWIMGKRTENESLIRTGRALFIYSAILFVIVVSSLILGYGWLTDWSYNYNDILPHLFELWGFTL